MKDQHKKITGYRDLTKDEIDLMNEIKDKGEDLRLLVDKLEDNVSLDKRCVSIGKTNLQTGIMYLVRSVAQPDSF